MNIIPEWAGTALLVVLIAAVCVCGAVSYAKKLSRGCCGGGSDPERRVEAARGEYPHRYLVRISGMSCKKCAQRIENGFNRQQGMKAVVDLKKAEATVCTINKVPELIIRKTVSDLGYSTVDIVSFDD